MLDIFDYLCLNMIMISNQPHESVEVVSVLHSQALHESETTRRQRNGLFAGTFLVSVTSGVLQAADIINGNAEWGPRAVSSLMIVGAVNKAFEHIDANKRAKSLADSL
jgi:hypothetical protein